LSILFPFQSVISGEPYLHIHDLYDGEDYDDDEESNEEEIRKEEDRL